MTRFRHLLLSALAFAAAGTAVAGEVTLFSGENFGGRRFVATSTVANLEFSDFNDRAASARVHSGQWQLCSDAYFRGRCVSLGQGNYPNLGAMGLAYNVSSLRDLWDHDSGGNPGGGPVGGGTVGGGPGNGGTAVILYDRFDFIGEAFRIGGFVPNLGNTGFNDRAASMVIYRGSWELCEDADFRGNCQVFGPGRYPNIGQLAGRVSSLREARGGGGGGGNWGGGGPAWGSGNRAILYENENLTGRQFVVDRIAANLGNSGFNDRASSLRIERGYWMFCSDANFEGECRTFGPGDYPSLPNGLSNRISSGRRVSDDYPYNQNPNWGGNR